MYEKGIRLDFSRPETAMGNATLESFNGRLIGRLVGWLRQECLNENRFMSLEDARCKIEAGRIHDSQSHPHCAQSWTPRQIY
ncbi:integrase core domain-containing protein [Edwardsiella anguillarum]|uniref:integrase core domain-containing protein n=1 Tax=Edwardsiella anguillarum TaxID=1821960 RepID=UPI003D49F690